MDAFGSLLFSCLRLCSAMSGAWCKARIMMIQGAPRIRNFVGSKGGGIVSLELV